MNISSYIHIIDYVSNQCPGLLCLGSFFYPHTPTSPDFWGVKEICELMELMILVNAKVMAISILACGRLQIPQMRIDGIDGIDDFRLT